ncbi:hypothetical protein CLAFUR4_09823 [Fulvia fulva]|nr:hypothetical protein CLAFUR4_09823 [Fulvia fulva]
MYTADGRVIEFRSRDDAIGAAAGHSLDCGVQHALVYQLNGLNGALKRCSGDSMAKCRFTTAYSSTTAQTANRAYVDQRIVQNAECVAPFPAPYCVTYWRKNSTEPYLDPQTRLPIDQQNWFL